MKKIVFVAAVLFAGYAIFLIQHGSIASKAPSAISGKSIGASDAILAEAFSGHESNLRVSGQGVVTALLPDDNSGSRHQKFIVTLSSGQTLLIAHNIDLAPRISTLREGDTVQFCGEYEWNEKGGVIHWTHRDPNSAHVAGWLQHHNQRYQ